MPIRLARRLRRTQLSRGRTRGLVAGAAAIAVAVALTGCNGGGSADAGKSTTLRLGVAAQSISFSPGSGAIDRTASRVVWDHLVERKGDGYRPMAAKSFTYNDAHTQLTLTLRSGLEFSNGEKIDAALIKQDILFYKDHGAFFSTITNVATPDDHTIVVTQSKADHNVMLSMWDMPIVTTESLADPGKYSSKVVSSGPYELDQKDSTSGSNYTFVRNPKYWHAKEYPYDKVTMTLLQDETSRLNALKSGQIDAASISASTAPDAKASGFVLHQFYGNFAGLIMGDRSGKISKPIGDVRVRQAIAMAFDRDSMVKSIYGGFAEADAQPFAEGTTGYQNDDKDAYAYNVKKAKQLMAAAGYAQGFTLTIPTYEPSTKPFESYLKQALGDIGITVKFDQQSDDTWLDAFSGGKYAVVPFGLPFAQSVDSADPDFFWNAWHNQTPETTSLLSQINSGTPQQVEQATDKLGKIELDQVWFAVWAHPSTIWATTKDVKLATPQYSDWTMPADFSPAN